MPSSTSEPNARASLRRPVHLAVGAVRGVARLELLEQLGVHGEALGVGAQLRHHRVEGRPRHARLHVRQHADRLRRPRHAHGGRRVGARLVERALELRLVVGERRLGLLERHLAALHERLDVELAHAAAGGDRLVHEWLRVARVVALVVAVAPVADEVDHDVLVEALAVLVGEVGDAHAGLGVVAVHVEDRRLDGLGHVAAVLRRARVLRRGGEADLVVDDEVDRPADPVAARVAHREAFRHHALSGECGVAVDEERQDAELPGPVDEVLPRAGRAEHDRVDRLEVARVGQQLDVHRRARA